MKDAFTSMPLPDDTVGEPVTVPNQCTAPNRAGGRCLRSATFGMNVCYMHGGRAPQTLASQSRRFKEAAGDAMNYLVAMMNDDTIEPSLRVRIVIALLDRTGHGASASLNITRDDAAPWTAWLTNDEIEQARALRDLAMARMDAGEPQLGGVREFSLPEVAKEVWLPKSDRPQIGDGDDAIEAVYTETRTEGQ